MKITLLSLCIIFFTVAGHSQLVFKQIIWQKSVSSKTGPKVRFKTVEKLKIKADKKNASRFRVIVGLKNTGKKPLKATVLRCAFSMRLTDIKTKKQSVWTVPFAVRERRIPIIKPSEVSNIKLPHFILSNYLKRLKNTGFWPNALKIQIMIEPDKDTVLEDNITTSVINIDYD